MKNIIGLDVGTASIGWAYINEAEKNEEQSKIVKLGVRIVPLSSSDQTDFTKGNAITINKGRTLARGARRNLQRFKQRRKALVNLLNINGLCNETTILTEDGKESKFETLKLRAKSVNEKISPEELARVFLKINKQRGYKSNRKEKNTDDGQLIDGMAVAKLLNKKNLTPGQYSLELLMQGKEILPEYYSSDLLNEFDRIWDFQKQFHSNILTQELYDEIKGKSRKVVSAIFWKKYNFYTAENKNDRKSKKIQALKWRVEALSKEKSNEIVAYVIADINDEIAKSSGYLGKISDNSKELYFNDITVGQYLYKQVSDNPNARLKNQVFYRKDYEEEFDRIWEEQSKHHKQLTPELKKKLKQSVIFYQRPLKSQKGLIRVCELEGKKIEIEKNGKLKTVLMGPKVCPKSSLLFQEFRIWQKLNDVVVENRSLRINSLLTKEEKELLFKVLTIKPELSGKDILKVIGKKEAEINMNRIVGNKTNASLFEAYQKILDASGHGDPDFSEKTYEEKLEMVERVFKALNINTSILQFDSEKKGQELEQQPMNRLWHLLYSYQGDDSVTGNASLVNKLKEEFGFETEYAKILASVAFEDDYGNLSTKAIGKILPHLKSGLSYDKAASKAGYNHSHSMTKEESENQTTINMLELVPKNSLRNPVVEMILNQMIHVVNSLGEKYGKPDEIRIELARELKNSIKERKEITEGIKNATELNKKIAETLINEQKFSHVSRKDIIKRKLYEELATLGYKTLYTDTFVSLDRLFTNEFDVDHIIPQSRLFDDSFSNKTLASRSVNLEKGDKTAFDYVSAKFGEEGAKNYIAKVESLKKQKAIGKAKYKKLLMRETDIPDGFIERDLRNTQYIAKKTREILKKYCKKVNTTSGSITEKLRKYWQLEDLLKELNYNKYDKQGLTHTIKDKDGREHKKITDWTKRNDHRHHAIDALVVAFTKHSHVQYFNFLNARKNDKHEKHNEIMEIENAEIERDSGGQSRIKPPIPLDTFRATVKQQLENLLISFKAKNKVVTKNFNKIKGTDVPQLTFSPRGQLHKETIYGMFEKEEIRTVEVGKKMDEKMIAMVREVKYRAPLLARLNQFGNDPKKAFTGRNSLIINPIEVEGENPETVPLELEIVERIIKYTTRKPIDKDLNVDKVVDEGIKQILKDRLAEFENVPKKAFANLDENPIWLNKAKRIPIKRVKIFAAIDPVALRPKKDKHGKPINDEKDEPVFVDFVETQNNHHVAIHIDAEGNLHEDIKTFFEVVERKNQNLPIIDKSLNVELGWKFLFSMKENECFVFPNPKTGFKPSDIDLIDENNFHLISPNLFRVQKLSKKDYFFRHHLETQLINKKELMETTFRRITSFKNLEGIVKVRIDHIGKIVEVGEY